jgi:hypothetical protein
MRVSCDTGCCPSCAGCVPLVIGGELGVCNAAGRVESEGVSGAGLKKVENFRTRDELAQQLSIVCRKNWNLLSAELCVRRVRAPVFQKWQEFEMARLSR